MSRFIVLGKLDKGYPVFDMEDSSVEVIDESQYAYCKGKGMDIGVINSSNHPFGLQVDGHDYSIFLPNGKLVYRGSFPKDNNRNDLFSPSIILKEVNCYRSSQIVLALICNCFCKYDIELPMTAVQLVVVSARNPIKSYLSMYTDYPVHFVDASYASYECEGCGGDYPTDCCMDASTEGIIIDRNKISVLGYRHSDVLPHEMDLCDKLNWLKIQTEY